MKLIFGRPALLLLLFPFFCSAVYAQEWKFEGKKSHPNAASDSWIDAAGNSYHNISVDTVVGTSGRLVSKSLLILDKHGHFNGRVQVNSCKNRASLFAFDNGRYLTTDFNCNQSGNSTRDSRVFDHKGNLMLTGEAFTLGEFATVRTKNGYTIFTQSGFSSEKPVMGIRTVDWDFNIEDELLDISELSIPEKGLSTVNRFLPVQTQEGNWAVSISAGKLSANKRIMDPELDFLFLTDGKSILGKFHFEQSNERIMSLQVIGDEVAVLSSIGSRDRYKLYVLDQKLNLKQILPLEIKGHFDAFLITEGNILLLSNQYDWENQNNNRYVLNVLDREGKLLRERLLVKHRTIINTFLPFGENSVLLAGMVVLSDSETYSLIWKLDIEPTGTPQENNTTAETEPEAAPSSPVSDLTVDNLSQEAMSVAVFPNPASIYINFALKNQETEQQSFHLKVHAMDGKLMHQASFKASFYELDIADYPSGTYSYSITNETGKKDFLSGKFVKIR